MRSLMIASSLVGAAIAFLPVSGSATAAKLANRPSPATPAACKTWASNQEDDAITMWSRQEDGTSPRAVGLKRLYDYCMGKEPPDIVYFGSDSGFDADYCKSHPGIKLCKDQPSQ
jgi:hypothetical protein